jgi:hypothetical protein
MSFLTLLMIPNWVLMAFNSFFRSALHFCATDILFMRLITESMRVDPASSAFAIGFDRPANVHNASCILTSTEENVETNSPSASQYSLVCWGRKKAAKAAAYPLSGGSALSAMTKTTPKKEELELHPDAWARFERAAGVAAKTPPQHRVKPNNKSASKRVAHGRKNQSSP